MIVEMKIKNLEEVKRAFIQAPSKIGPEIKRAIRKSITLIQTNIQKEAPVSKEVGHNANLRSKIVSYMVGDLTGVVESQASYSIYVELGTRPHIIVPVNKRVLANKRTGQIFGKLVRHPGTAPNPFFKRGLDNSKSFVEAEFNKVIANSL